MFKIRCLVILKWLAMKQCQTYAILGVVVLSFKKKIVKENQFTERSGFMLLADNTLKRAPFTRLHVKTNRFEWIGKSATVLTTLIKQVLLQLYRLERVLK